MIYQNAEKSPNDFIMKGLILHINDTNVAYGVRDGWRGWPMRVRHLG